jgi:hypothetical protein
MNGQNEQATMPDSIDLDLVLTDLAVEWVRAAMRSVDSDVVKPLHWWERAKSSLITAAAVADTWPQMVSRQLSKLQVKATSEETSRAIETIGMQLTEFGEKAWLRFRTLCERDALYIVAMAQAESARKKQARKEKQLTMLKDGE